MGDKNKMPPTRTFGKTTSAAELADEFEDLQFLPPVRSSPPSMKNFVTFAQSAASLSNNPSNSGSISASSSNSASNSTSTSNSASPLSCYNDDFTLGLRVIHPSPGSSNNNINSGNASTSNRRRDHHREFQRDDSNYNSNAGITSSPSQHQHHHTSRRASHPSNAYRHSNSKERYVFSNFRFLMKESSNLPKTVDDPFDWLSIEMVLVPEIENVLCPICLDVPCVPRFTRCGHIYCLPCLLQYFQTTEPSTGGLGNNWRNCPVCAEPLHLKQLRPVKFCPATEPSEGEIFHSVLIQKPVGALQPHRPIYPNSDLSTISPFQRVIPVGRSFVVEQILNPEMNHLREEMKMRRGRGEESLELSFIEAAIKSVEDVKKRVASETFDSPQSSKSTTTSIKNEEFYYFYQSRDGLNVFLHPLCMKILKHHFQSYEAVPPELSLPIIQLERVLVTSSNRKRFKYLDHLSLGTQIILVEVDLEGLVSESSLQAYDRELSARQSVRDQKTAHSNRDVRRDRSILEEWKMMEDDYYSVAQVSAAMDIRVPESVKLDNLDDEASFPLPSSYNNNNNNNQSTSTINTFSTRRSPSAAAVTANSFIEAGSPSFSALAHSLNSPFTYNINNNNSFNSNFNNNSNNSINEEGLSISSGNTGKKKILLFSSGLNLTNNNNGGEKKRR